MKFCPECGSPVTESNKFCPNCGFQLSRSAAGPGPSVPPAVQSPSPSPAQASLVQPERRHRRTKETLLGLESTLFGLLLLAFGVITATAATKSAAVASLFVVVYVGVGLLAASVGYALLLQRAWLERIRRAAGLCSLLLAALFLVFINVLYLFMGVLGLVLCVGLLYYLSPKRRAARNGVSPPAEIV